MSKEDKKDTKITAAREFSEETAGLFFSDDIERDGAYLVESFGKMSEEDMQKKQIVKSSTEKALNLLDESRNSVWHLKQGYHLYIVKVDYVDLEQLNKVFEKAPKRRSFQWIPFEDIEKKTTPFPLYNRVAKMKDIQKTFLEIQKKEFD